jgi:hypothetical protein
MVEERRQQKHRLKLGTVVRGALNCIHRESIKQVGGYANVVESNRRYDMLKEPLGGCGEIEFDG